MREHKDKAKNATARTARRTAIAKGLIEQKTPTVIAQQVGISRKTLYAELAQPETQELIRSWMEPHHAAIKRMIPRALAAIHTGLKPSQKMPDRLTAVKTLGTVMGWAQGATDGDGDRTSKLKFSGQMEELLAIYRRVTTHAGELPAPTPQT